MILRHDIIWQAKAIDHPVEAVWWVEFLLPVVSPLLESITKIGFLVKGSLRW